MIDKNPLKNGALSRRTFLAGAGTAAAATLVAGCGDNGTATTINPPTAPAQPAYSDTDILNFALNLEYLEAEFYLRAATGAGIPAADAGGSAAGTVTGGARITGLSAQQQSYLNILAYDEYNHVKVLRSALGAAAVVRPAIDLTNSFNALATIATASSTKLTTFNPFASFNNWLVGGFIFEDVGVTAYLGAAGLLSSKSILQTAGQFLAIESYHAAVLRTLIVGTSLSAAATPFVAGDQTYLTLAQQIQQVRASLSGGSTLAAGKELALSSGVVYNGTTAPTIGSSTIVNADTNAIAFSRTLDQVLHIVYGAATASTGYAYGLSSGGFFPAGLNGNIKQTYS